MNKKVVIPDVRSGIQRPLLLLSYPVEINPLKKYVETGVNSITVISGLISELSNLEMPIDTIGVYTELDSVPV